MRRGWGKNWEEEMMRVGNNKRRMRNKGVMRNKWNKKEKRKEKRLKNHFS